MKKFLVVVQDETEFDRTDDKSIADELAVVLENEGYTVSVEPVAGTAK